MPTERFSLSADAWTDLGPTPCFLQLASPICAALFCVDTAAPSDLDAPAHVLTGAAEAGWCDIALAGQRVYARSLAPTGGATLMVSR